MDATKSIEESSFQALGLSPESEYKTSNELTLKQILVDVTEFDSDGKTEETNAQTPFCPHNLHRKLCILESSGKMDMQ